MEPLQKNALQIAKDAREEFKELDWKNIFEVMRKPAWVFDSRICLEKEKLKDIGFKVWTLGTP